MVTLTKEQVKEIADQLDCGFRGFIHRLTRELLFVPDTLRLTSIDIEAWKEELEKLDNNFGDYYEIQAMQSSVSFQVMTDFTEQLAVNNPLRQRLFRALNNKKPFRKFKFEIDNSGEFRQEWFDFKNAKLIEWVEQQIDNLAHDDVKIGSH